MTQAAPIPITLTSLEPAFIKEPCPIPVPPETKVEEEPQPVVVSGLNQVSRLLIAKKLHVRSVVTLRGTRNKYSVKTEDDIPMYTIEEKNKWWVGYLALSLRPLKLTVKNMAGEVVLTIRRSFAFTSRVLPCQLQRINVFAPENTLLGCIQQEWTPLKPKYLVRDAGGDIIYTIRGPRFSIVCFKDVIFDIEKADGSVCGGTCKRWMGVKHALFRAPIVDFFGVAFDQEIPIDHKLLLFSATLLFDYMYY